MIYPKRHCKYCKGLFIPTQKTQVFCKTAHKDAYHKHGSLPFDKLMARVEKETRRIVREELASVEAERRLANAG
jgi:hypothetical protein